MLTGSAALVLQQQPAKDRTCHGIVVGCGVDSRDNDACLHVVFTLAAGLLVTSSRRSMRTTSGTTMARRASVRTGLNGAVSRSSARWACWLRAPTAKPACANV